MGMIKHSQNTQSKTFLTSSQYFKKEVGLDGVHFLHAVVDIIVFDGSGQTCPKYPKYEVGNIFAIYLEKRVTTAFVFYCDAKYSDILQGSSHVRCYLFYSIFE